MDKRKVIMAYRRGFITIQECAQILGVNSVQAVDIVEDPKWVEFPSRSKLPLNS